MPFVETVVEREYKDVVTAADPVRTVRVHVEVQQLRTGTIGQTRVMLYVEGERANALYDFGSDLVGWVNIVDSATYQGRMLANQVLRFARAYAEAAEAAR